MMRVKMCGMKTVAAARAAEEAGADYVGFIFAEKSKRYIVPTAAREIARELRHVKKVGVFVDAPMNAVNEIAAFVGLDYVSCSPFRVPIARLAAAQAAVEEL